MITYVNTVLVGTGKNAIVSAEPQKAADMGTPSADAGKYVIMNLDQDATNIYDIVKGETQKIKVGIVTNKNVPCRMPDKTVVYKPIIKWSNVINKDDIKSFHFSKWFQSSEEKVKIDFNTTKEALLAEFAKGNKRIVVRLTYKDLPTRYRKWTESYEYVTKIGDDATSIAKNIAMQINTQYKRARVTADGTTTAGTVELTAMPYTDDDKNDTINWAAKVRFSANVYWTDPEAPAFASKNKYSIQGATITKNPADWCQTDGKLVRDREAQAMGYQGILNRGEGTWPIIKPDMVTDINEKYDGITLEFENMYRTADDLFRKTKQTLEIYDVTGTLATLKTKLEDFAFGASEEPRTADDNGITEDTEFGDPNA